MIKRTIEQKNEQKTLLVCWCKVISWGFWLHLISAITNMR